MNLNPIVTAKPLYAPVSLEQSAPRPVTPVADNPGDIRDVVQQASPNSVYRGEVLESTIERSYRPQQNLQISPENSRAISTYQNIASQPPIVGRILDGFI